MSDFTSTFRVPLAWEPYRLSGVAGSQYGLFHPLLRQPRGRYSVGTHQLESWDVAEIGKFGGKPLTLDEVHRIKNMLCAKLLRHHLPATRSCDKHHWSEIRCRAMGGAGRH